MTGAAANTYFYSSTMASMARSVHFGGIAMDLNNWWHKTNINQQEGLEQVPFSWVEETQVLDHFA